MGDPMWWAGMDARVNGVFKGGGAKGLLYAGALEALAERGVWFRAVGGASAGAITAPGTVVIRRLESTTAKAWHGLRDRH